jgi:Polyketide cyclase / dehydrase and lipid transport
MHFDCHPVEPSFFDTAPMRFRHEVDLDATPAKVFAIFDDASSWPQWFHAIHKVEWTSPAPHGVGSTRTVTLATATIFEHFYCWEPDRRCSFYLTGIEPRLPVAAGGPLSRMYFDGMFKSACEHLQTYVRND